MCGQRSLFLSFPGFCLIFLLASRASVLAQQRYCDPNLEPTDNTFGYQDRDQGDRCEGLYILPVSGNLSLPIVSFTTAFEKYDLTLDKPLRLEWGAPPSYQSGIQIRALGIRPRLYYRMDTSRPRDSTAYTWPSNLLARLSILREDIGVIGWYRCLIGKKLREIHVPLRITQQQGATSSGRYRLVLLPSRELKTVSLTLSPVIPQNGRLGTPIYKDKQFECSYCPADQALTIPIEFSGLRSAGIYCLRIGATLENGGILTADIWFYHPDVSATSKGKAPKTRGRN